MDVRIAGGKFRGRKIVIPESFQDFRPTKSMVREAVCSSIQADIAGAKVLELCAGSGVFSFELLSRGADSVVAVELSSLRADFIEKTAAELGIQGQITIKCMSAQQYFQNNPVDELFDVIFFDPPYYDNDLSDLIVEALQSLSSYGVLVFESATDDSYVESVTLPDGVDIKSRKYGKSFIRYYRKSEE